MATLFLIRHATNDWVGKRLAGWTPGVHLNEEGRRQAAALARRLADVPLTAIYSSPLERAVETAEAIARPQGLTVRILEAVGEVRFGSLEGESLEALSQSELWQAIQFYPSGVRFPGGESVREMQSRVVAGLETLLQRHPAPEEIVAVVSHSDVIKAAVAHFIGLPLDLFQRLVISPASVTVITFGKRGPRLLRLNDDGSLPIPRRPERDRKGEEKEPPDSQEGGE